MSKLVVHMKGGLGNQLFAYAAARRLAMANDAELVIDDISGFEYDHRYQRQYMLDRFNIRAKKATCAERLEPFPRLHRYIKTVSNRRSSFEERTYIQQEGIDFDPRLLHVRFSNTVHLEGYWQGEGYFKDIEDVIRSDLQIKPPNDAANAAMASRIKGCLAVAMHVRFFDAPNVSSLYNVSNGYYVRAVEQMETLSPGAHYFVFSDHSAVARGRVPLPDDRVTCVAHNRGDMNAYADLWLMTQCRHFIIANSTFSWWGAWLGGGQDKIVISPNMKVDGKSAWGFRGLIPHTWMTI